MTDGTREAVIDGVQHYRRTLGKFATGVAIVTTRSAGIDHAMTLNSLVSVSLNPPLVLICIQGNGRFQSAISDGTEWAVSVLADGHEDVSRSFARRGRSHGSDLQGYGWAPGEVTTLPILEGAIASLECRTVEAHEIGDHTVVVGAVLAANSSPTNAAPLLFFSSRYRALDRRSPGRQAIGIRATG